ncbi:MAG: hypothetical protein JNL83_38160 [Myxococcales bacterium]|nr:hypothetical protein [Myxococcales bacterium]
MLRIACVMVAVLGACGSDPDDGADGGVPQVPVKGVSNDATATSATVAIDDAFHKAADRAQASANSAPPEVMMVQLRIPCDSGTASSVLTTDSGTGVLTAQHVFTFNACSVQDERLSGRITWESSSSFTPTSTSGYVQFDGAVAYEGPTYAGNFSFNRLRIEYQDTGAGRTYQATGTYTIGGTTYNVDLTQGSQYF